MTEDKFSVHRDATGWHLEYEDGRPSEVIGSTIVMLNRLEKLIGVKPAAMAVQIGIPAEEFAS